MGIEKKETDWGAVYRSSTCKDNYETIVTSEYYRKPSGLIRRRKRDIAITLQRPALESLRECEAKLGREIKVTGTSRTCALQAALYKKDPQRYAPPNVGLHCQSLAIDVSTLDSELKTRVREVLTHHGWTQARPYDEPWHFSFGWTA